MTSEGFRGDPERLVWMYLRQGSLRKALQQVHQLLLCRPVDSSLQAAHALLVGLTQHPDQRLLRCGLSRVSFCIKDGSIFIPARIHGVAAYCMIDSGATLSLMAESEALRCGIAIEEVAPRSLKLYGVTGNVTGFRSAVALDVEVGEIQFTNVPFVIVKDDQFPFPSGFGSALGLSIMTAIRRVQWTHDGECVLGPSDSEEAPRKSNLYFDNADLVMQARFRECDISLLLDTGSASSTLWPPFAAAFPAFLHRESRMACISLNGISGQAEVAASILPALTVSLGEFDGVLRPAHVLRNPTTPNSRWLHGHLGMDVLLQARQVSIDLEAMALTME
jgi:gag-polyprotein putative aspartyl protease